MTLTKQDKDFIDYITLWHLNKIPNGRVLGGKDQLEEVSTERLLHLYKGTVQLIKEIKEVVMTTQKCEPLFMAIDYISTKLLFERVIKDRLRYETVEGVFQ
ncbi:hypothetical protein [Litchfieldia salsa]|uniref:Uncharacterized protein n=1 Tax=Litchfieldia salsa TaxID=930152 RepID=A0A1H0Q2W8_9BACI|nr:hypothetical protein [Litchfieldia salsa]SDP11440.1 hypothetical protein SAMN05216565_101564 [Litchfieldia salsa]